MINFKALGQRVKNARREKEYTQEVFSEMLGISTEHLSRIETGSYRPSLGLVEKICEALEISEEALMFGARTDNPNAELASKIECLSPEKKQVLEKLVNLMCEQ